MSQEMNYINREFERILASPDTIPTMALVHLLVDKGIISYDEFEDYYQKECQRHYFSVSSVIDSD